MTPPPASTADPHEATHLVTQEDLDGFAALSGDDNPIHVDPAFAATTAFRVPVAHGMFLFALVRAELHRVMPAATVARQELMFPSPTPVGTLVTVRLEPRDPIDGLLPVETSVVHHGDTGLRGVAWLGDRIPFSPPTAVDARTEAGDGTGWWETAVGRTATLTRRFDHADLRRHRFLAGETPPEQIPESLVAGLFSRLLGVELPGPGTNYLKQRMDVHRAATVGEVLTATVQIVRVRPEKRLVDLHTECRTSDGAMVVTGQALVLARGAPATSDVESR